MNLGQNRTQFILQTDNRNLHQRDTIKHGGFTVIIEGSISDVWGLYKVVLVTDDPSKFLPERFANETTLWKEDLFLGSYFKCIFEPVSNTYIKREL